MKNHPLVFHSEVGVLDIYRVGLVWVGMQCILLDCH